MKDRRGFTLIELLLYISILGTLLGAVTVFFSLSNETRVKSEVIGSVNDQGTYLMDYLTTTVRGATAITTPAAAATGTGLTLTVPTSANSPTVFALSSGAVTVKKGTAAAVSLTSNGVVASALSFSNLTRSSTNGIVQISVTLTANNPTGRQEYSFSKTFTTAAEVGW